MTKVTCSSMSAGTCSSSSSRRKNKKAFQAPGQQQEQQQQRGELYDDCSSPVEDPPKWQHGSNNSDSLCYFEGRQQQQQHVLVPEEDHHSLSNSGGGGGSGSGGYHSQQHQTMAKAGFMSFDTEDRLEIFNNSKHSSSSSAVPASAGLDWPRAYPGDIGEPWARQQAGGGGQQGFRQSRSYGMGGGQQQHNRPGSASVSGPSQRLHEMKEYFRYSQHSPPVEGGGGQGRDGGGGDHDDQPDRHHHPGSKHEYSGVQQHHEPERHHRYSFIEDDNSVLFRSSRDVDGGGGGSGGGLQGLACEVINSNGFHREGSANGSSSIASPESRNVGDGEIGGDGENGGGGGGGSGGSYGKSAHYQQHHQQHQRSDILPWQHEMSNGNGYPLTPSLHQHYQGGGSKPATAHLPSVSIGCMPGGGGGNHNSIDGDGEDDGSIGGACGGGGTDPGDIGSVEFDPQADCRPSVIGSHHHNHGNATVSTGGGSPASWWRDPPEPASSNFPWDLQLPNPAPPLAFSSHTIGGGNSGGGLQGSTLGGIGVGGGGEKLGGGGSLIDRNAGVSTVRGGGDIGLGAMDHSPLCRCDTCKFGKPSAASLASLGPAPSIGGGHRRHGSTAVTEQRLSQPSSALDILENGGAGAGSGRAGGGAMFVDTVGRGPYGSGGGLRWTSNSSPISASGMTWGHGSSRNGGGGGGEGGGEGYLTARKLELLRRGHAPPCDSLVPSGSHAPSYNVVPANPRSLLHANSLCPGGGDGSNRYGTNELKPLTVVSGDPDGVLFGRNTTIGRRRRGGVGAGGGDMPVAKRARVMKREVHSVQLSPIGTVSGLSGEDVVFSRLMERICPAGGGGGGRGGAGRGRSTGGGGGHGSSRIAAEPWGDERDYGRNGDGDGGGKNQPTNKPKKATASSRKCRGDGCNSHPNFGIEEDRRAVYCAKHKLPGMVNVKAPRCREPGCIRNPVYGNPGDPRATFCLSHKSATMVDVKNRCCEHPGCKRQPSFGLIGDRRANFCYAHKLPTHVNIRRARAKAN